ncbi:MAG: hypothetical protein IID15_07715, partial [Candidatus Marinimicrobia bacterium]|nr:hypothetical protein [Candidatus Neomarinimicrobiota bacterium]
SAEHLESMLASEQFVEISGPDKDDLAHVPLSSEEGIQVAIGMSDYGLLVYELRIPLVANDGTPHAVGAAPGQTIGIGFETGSLTPQGGRRSGFSPAGGRGGGISVGGRGGRSGGGRRGGGFRTGGGRGPSPAQTSQPLNHWVKVTLAKESQESAGG